MGSLTIEKRTWLVVLLDSEAGSSCPSANHTGALLNTLLISCTDIQCVSPVRQNTHATRKGKQLYYSQTDSKAQEKQRIHGKLFTQWTGKWPRVGSHLSMPPHENIAEWSESRLLWVS
jgi:hypothetical protein